ncbi:hypothetical protein RI129_000493 [Pyrocoelia pectoralis]|uniref:Major facilitator superfamily (MFS) profile domain-containing protein n=1 Tax=Pyrocoelia pectoralis TaxID=417401 RepID=A0AAN7VRP6_9COLE
MKYDHLISITFHNTYTYSYGKFNIFVLIATGGCLMSVIMETMGMMFINPVAECDLHLSVTMKGYLSAANFLGVVTSSHLWGFLGDTYGRRTIVIISMVSSFTVTLISSIAPFDWMLILLRFINGLLIGGASAVVYAYSGEFHDDNYRPKVISWMSSFVAIGNMIIPTLAWIVLPGQWSFKIPLIDVLFKPWRLLIITYGLPTIIFAACIFSLPESPKYLLTKGKETEALLILRKMYTINSGKSSAEFPVIRLILDEDINFTDNRGFLKLIWEQTCLLFNKRFVIVTFMVCTLQFGVFMATSGFYMWYPEIMNRIATYERENRAERSTICGAINYNSILRNSVNETLEPTCKEDIQPEVFTVGILMGAFFTVTYLTIGSLINIVGKKNFLLLLFVISASSGLAAQYLSGSAIIKIFMVIDLYPTHIRAMALAVSLMVGRFGAVSGSHVSGLIFYGICNFSYPIFAAFHIVLIVLVLLLPISTKITKMIEPII